MTSRQRRTTVAVAVAAGLLLALAATLGIPRLFRGEKIARITGAVIAQNDDPHLQRPIGNATVVAEAGTLVSKSVSEGSGLFRLTLNPPIAAGQPVKIVVRHPGYEPFAFATRAGDCIYVLRLKPNAQAARRDSGHETRISNIRVRYATHTTSTSTVGTAVRTFDIANTGNLPCGGRTPCSPDRKWKAAIGSLSLETGEQNKAFRNVRVSCIAGPCPFTAIESDQFSRGGPAIRVSVRNWSDTVTYLLEAEVAQTMESELIRHTYPVTFGRSMNFTLPAAASGPSIEADVDGLEIVFPLGPELRLSWATCRVESASDGTRQYRCELKAGYRFD